MVHEGKNDVSGFIVGPGEVIATHNEYEKYKGEQGRVELPYVVSLAWLFPEWYMTELGSEEIMNLQLMSGVIAESNETTEIFEKTGTTVASEVAEQIPHLKSVASPKLLKWLNRLDSSMKNWILNEDVAPITLLTPGTLQLGEVLDGNRRILLACLLIQEGYNTKIPAFVARVPYRHWKFMNMIEEGVAKITGFNKEGRLSKARGTYGSEFTPEDYNKQLQRSVLSKYAEYAEMLGPAYSLI
jgi:hypothetical protein